MSAADGNEVNGLPFPEDHGQEGTWVVTDQDGREVVIAGTFLGMGSSHRPHHKGHPATDTAPRGVHCSTCRWTEIRIFSDASEFYIVNCGASDVDGERDLIKVTPVATAFELVETLTTRDRRTGQNMLPFPARRALAQAADHSPRLRDAYINSPVT